MVGAGGGGGITTTCLYQFTLCLTHYGKGMPWLSRVGLGELMPNTILLSVSLPSLAQSGEHGNISCCPPLTTTPRPPPCSQLSFQPAVLGNQASLPLLYQKYEKRHTIHKHFLSIHVPGTVLGARDSGMNEEQFPLSG